MGANGIMFIGKRFPLAEGGSGSPHLHSSSTRCLFGWSPSRATSRSRRGLSSVAREGDTGRPFRSKSGAATRHDRNARQGRKGDPGRTIQSERRSEDLLCMKEAASRQVRTMMVGGKWQGTASGMLDHQCCAFLMLRNVHLIERRTIGM